MILVGPKLIVNLRPTFDSLRRQTWPSPVEAHREPWDPAKTLRLTADCVLLTGFKSWYGRQEKQKKHIEVSDSRPGPATVAEISTRPALVTTPPHTSS